MKSRLLALIFLPFVLSCNDFLEEHPTTEIRPSTIRDMEKIIDIQLRGLRARIAEIGYRLNVTPAAKKFVADAGYDPEFGARPLKRAVQKYIEDPVSEFLIGTMRHQDKGNTVPDIPVLTVGLSADRKGTEVKLRHAELCPMQS